MATTNPTPPGPLRRRFARIARWRHRVQFAFLLVWLAPLGKWLHAFPSCVYHCYACPLSSFACPIGIVANFAAAGIWPLLTIGVLVMTAALVGSLVCGWACPFGFLQDLTAKIPVRKVRIPNWMSYGRYVVLIAFVILVPSVWGESNPFFICRLCPAGALEAGVPRMIMGALGEGPSISMSATKWGILAGFLVAIVFAYRPWCRIFCPLGGFLALFNRVSVFHLRFDSRTCTECNLCRSRCEMDVPVEKTVNNRHCIRCMECTACGAIHPSLKKIKPGDPPATGSGT